MKRTGACHCGSVTIEVVLPGDPRPHRCNCSICTLKGSISIDVPLDALSVTSGNGVLSRYTFNTGVAQHWFCSNCGIHLFHQLRSDPGKYAINGASIAGLGPYDFAAMPVHDGAYAHPKETGQPARVAGRIRYEPADD